MKRRKQVPKLLTSFYWPKLWKVVSPEIATALALSFYRVLASHRAQFGLREHLSRQQAAPKDNTDADQ